MGNLVGVIIGICILIFGFVVGGWAYSDISIGKYCNEIGNNYFVEKVGTTHFNCCGGEVVFVEGKGYILEDKCIPGGKVPGWWGTGK